MDESWYELHEGAVVLAVRVQPKASKDEIAGVVNGRLKIRLTAAPVDGKANRHLQAFLAERLGVAKSRVVLLAGDTGREKKLRIEAPTTWP